MNRIGWWIMNKSFSIGQVLEFAWNAFKDNALILVLLTLMTLGVQLLFGLFNCAPDPKEVIEIQSGVPCI